MGGAALSSHNVRSDLLTNYPTMFKLAALSALVAGAAAFAPAQQGASSTALASAFENEVSRVPRL